MIAQGSCPHALSVNILTAFQLLRIRMIQRLITVAIGATGLAGGAAITTALAAIGPGGMIGGLVTLGVIGLISEGISKYGVDAIFSAVVKELYRRGETKEQLKQKIKRYPISKDLKRKLNEYIERS